MSGGKETPRQKMIGMMYLVLTALLALNVSKEILNAFIVVNDGLENTNANFQNKNDVTYAAFSKALANDAKKVKPFHDKALKVQAEAKKMYDYIEGMKVELMRETEKNDTIKHLASMSSKDNYDVATHYLIGENPENATGKAVEIKKKLAEYRKFLMDQVDAKDQKNMRIGLETKDVYAKEEEKNISWENNAFYHSPIAAVITVMSKIQNDIKNAEADVINYLYGHIDASSFKFDNLSAKVIPNSNYVLIGDEYKADIFISASSSTSNPSVIIGELNAQDKLVGAGNANAVKVENGVGIYKISPSSEGEVKYSGVIRVKDPSGEGFKDYPFKTSFMAARPAAVVSPTKMNVLYIGVDNPIDISVPGVPSENLRPSMSGGSLSGAKGKYVAKVNSGLECTINVGADVGGTTKSMGTAKFRIKRVPDPVAKFAGKKASDALQKNQLLAAQGVIAEMENFDFDLKFQVVSFDLSCIIGGVEASAKSNGNLISADQKVYMQKVKIGGKVFIDNVKVRAPNGEIRTIPGVTIKVL